MATHDSDRQEQTKQECFLCTLDPMKHACHEAQLVGRIVAAHERLIDGARTPVIILDTGTTRVEVQLDDQYYRSFIKGLKVRGDVLSTYNLTLHIYHLPTLPTTVEYNGHQRHCYKANAYTLAVLQPDILLNITDLNQAEYCPRQYVLNRLSPSVPSPATIRGNLVHHCFKELLKAHDRGKFIQSNAGTPVGAPDALSEDTQSIVGTRFIASADLSTGQTAACGADCEHGAKAADAINLVPTGMDGLNRETALVSPPNTTEGEGEPEAALDALYRHLEEAFELNSIEMALANVSVESMRAEVAPHLASLAHWYVSERDTLWDMPGSYGQTEEEGNQVRAETFLLAPEIGLRGRLDLFWQQAGRQRLLELKTGGASGQLPKQEHRWQVYGYHALLAVRRDSKMKKALATLLYSGTPGRAEAFGIPSTIREIQRVNERRSMLVLSRITSIPPAPPGPSRCTKCSMLTHCQNVSSLLGWQPPEPGNREPTVGTDVSCPPVVGTDVSRPPLDPAEDRAFFARYYQLLQIEGNAGEQQQALLWKTPMAERIERGTAVSGLQSVDAPTLDKDGWKQTFACNNTSELREGDEILLSNGNPITGEVVSGTILAISSERISVWTREVIASPSLIDRYDNDLVHVRTLQNLLRWLQAETHMRDLVAGKIRPRFIGKSVKGRTDFNSEQNLAVERTMQMQDYLLIHGPPGTGKTSVIAEIVKRLCQQGQRVMLAAFTNQAVDNMLKRLEHEGFDAYLRLGHERSVDELVRPHLLQNLVSVNEIGDQGNLTTPAIVREVLRTMPVIASTTATWSSDKYSLQPARGEVVEDAGLHFDVAIIDEAGQLTIPAILGALRFAKRFILVGDEKQLPPLVLSKEAAEQGLANSLFSTLKQRDDSYMQQHPMAVSACVPLRTQYRMNKWISHFSSTLFYDRQLLAHDSVANRRLVFTCQPATEHEDPGLLKAIKPGYPLVFLDVAAEKVEHVEDVKTAVKLSNAEARAVRDIVAALLARGIAPQDIGIIAPYRAQVANIRRHLLRANPENGWQGLPSDSSLSIDTVDRFQGGERKVIIMSFATSEEPTAESPRREFLINPNRLNVALTRAQRKLILVGCIPALQNLPTFSRLITYCRSMGTLIPSV